MNEVFLVRNTTKLLIAARKIAFDVEKASESNKIRLYCASHRL